MKTRFIGRQNRMKTSSATSPKAQSSAQFIPQTKKHQASIIPPVLKAFGQKFLFSSILKLIYDLLAFVSPQLLKLLIDFVSDEKAPTDISSSTTFIDAINDGYAREPLWHGIFFAILLFATACIQTLFLAQHHHLLVIVALRIRTALIGSIYKKALCLSNSARKESTVGEIVNLMAVGEFCWIFLNTFPTFSRNYS